VPNMYFGHSKLRPLEHTNIIPIYISSVQISITTDVNMVFSERK
jgi:hypothetical protein